MRAYQVILADSSAADAPREVAYTHLTEATAAEVRDATHRKYPGKFIVDIRALPKRTPIH